MKSQITRTSLAAALLAWTGVAQSTVDEDRQAVAALDTQYQEAVKNNDAETMGRILADDFVLVVGNGKTYTRADLLDSARSGMGDTAVVTARLWLKGINDGAAFERRLWFSDTYVRTPAGWRYAFGQASLPLPPE